MLKAALLATAMAVALSSCGAKTSCDPRLPTRYEGTLVRGAGSLPDDGKIFFIVGGERRWVLSMQWLTDHGFAPTDVRSISNDDLACLPDGPTLR